IWLFRIRQAQIDKILESAFPSERKCSHVQSVRNTTSKLPNCRTCDSWPSVLLAVPHLSWIRSVTRSRKSRLLILTSIWSGTGRTSSGSQRNDSRLASLVYWNISLLSRPNVLCQGPDYPVVRVLLVSVCNPARDPITGKDCGHNVIRDAQCMEN